MRKPVSKRKRGKPRKSKPDVSISARSAILMFAMLNVALDSRALERALKLALRDPDLIGAGLRTVIEGQGVDVDEFMRGEPATSATKSEVLEFAEPALKKGVEMAALAQIFDLYLFGKELTPENLVYAFYIGTRFVLLKERKPTKEESKRVWEFALRLARTSKIGAPHWRDLEHRGQIYLKDWLDTVKENARKRYETFLKQKKQAEERAEESLKSLVSFVFGEEDL